MGISRGSFFSIADGRTLMQPFAPLKLWFRTVSGSAGGNGWSNSNQSFGGPGGNLTIGSSTTGGFASVQPTRDANWTIWPDTQNSSVRWDKKWTFGILFNSSAVFNPSTEFRIIYGSSSFTSTHPDVVVVTGGNRGKVGIFLNSSGWRIKTANDQVFSESSIMGSFPSINRSVLAEIVNEGNGTVSLYVNKNYLGSLSGPTGILTHDTSFAPSLTLSDTTGWNNTLTITQQYFIGAFS